MFSFCIPFPLILIVYIVDAKDSCPVNVVFGLDGSSFVAINGNSEGETTLFTELTNVQKVYRNMNISEHSVKGAIPQPMGCASGGSWTLQDSISGLDNVAKSVNRFVYTCFGGYKLSNYIQAMNQEILVNQTVDQGVNYVFVIFTASTDVNDVNQAISLRKKYFDPKGYGLVIVRVLSKTASNLGELQTKGLFDLYETDLDQQITSSICPATTPSPTPYYCPQNYRVNVVFELDVTDCSVNTATKEVNAVYSTINSWKINMDRYKVNLPDPLGLVGVGMHYGSYSSNNNTVYLHLQHFLTAAQEENPCMNSEPIVSFLRPWYYQVIGNSQYTDFGIPHPIVLFTRASEQSDVANAITYRRTYLDPYNAKLYVVSVNATANLNGLSSNGKIYDINDPNLSNYLNGDICTTPDLINPNNLQ